MSQRDLAERDSIIRASLKRQGPEFHQILKKALADLKEMEAWATSEGEAKIVASVRPAVTAVEGLIRRIEG